MSHIVLDRTPKKKAELPPIVIKIWCAGGYVVRTALEGGADSFSWQSFDSTPELDRVLEQWFADYSAGRHTDPSSFVSVGDHPPFTQRVLEGLLQLPFGCTTTYQQLAEQVGSPRAARAIGNGCGRNPIPLFLPCHRVVAANGIGGFSQDPVAKRELLGFEEAAKK